MKMACVVPQVSQGSGGIRTILNNMDKLRRHYDSEVDLYILPHIGIDPKKASKEIEEYYGLLFQNVFYEEKLKDGYDVVVASAWNTVDMVESCDSPNKFYFVQDYEPWFYPMGTTRIMAEGTYSKGLNHIVLGRWLSNMISETSEGHVWSIDFGSDQNVYKPIPGISKERAVCAIWQPDKPRRMHELLFETLTILESVDPELKVYLYGSEEPLPSSLTNVCHLGILSIEGCNELYNKCVCGISLSSSNPSRIPFEMMTSGLPVIELYRDNNIYDFPDKGVLLCDVNPESLAEAILSLVNDPTTCNEMSHIGIEYMKERKIENEAKGFIDGIQAFISDEGFLQTGHLPLYNSQPYRSGQRMIEVYRSMRERKNAAVIEGYRVISANKILFKYEFDEDTFDNYRLAIWKESDQHDLMWLSMKKKSNGYAECLWEVPDNNFAYPNTYNVHLYGKADRLTFINNWEKSIKKESGAGTITIIL